MNTVLYLINIGNFSLNLGAPKINDFDCQQNGVQLVECGDFIIKSDEIMNFNLRIDS
jgi:hypothetical protein